MTSPVWVAVTPGATLRDSCHSSVVVSVANCDVSQLVQCDGATDVNGLCSDQLGDGSAGTDDLADVDVLVLHDGVEGRSQRGALQLQGGSLEATLRGSQRLLCRYALRFSLRKVGAPFARSVSSSSHSLVARTPRSTSKSYSISACITRLLLFHDQLVVARLDHHERLTFRDATTGHNCG